MRILSFSKAAILGAALIGAISIVPTTLRAEDHKNARNYHDRDHNDDHHWDNHEDQAYRMWAKENHRRNTNFAKLRENDQQAYWGWRHDHSDAILKINIR